MTSRNDITGDAIVSKPSRAYADNYDAIFRKGNMETVAPSQLDRIEAKLDFLIEALTEEPQEELETSLDGQVQSGERDQSQAL